MRCHGHWCSSRKTDSKTTYQIGVHETCSRALLLTLLPGKPRADALEGNDVYEAALNLVIGLESLLRWHRRELVWHSVASHLQTLSLMASSPAAARSVDAVQAGDAALDAITAILQQQVASKRVADIKAGDANISGLYTGDGDGADGPPVMGAGEGLYASSHSAPHFENEGDGEDGYWSLSARREARGVRSEDKTGSGEGSMVIGSACSLLWQLAYVNRSVHGLQHVQQHCFWRCSVPIGVCVFVCVCV